MPQGEGKSDSEVIEFKVMLPNINLLYLFCDVLILLDLSYLSRFWYRCPKYSPSMCMYHVLVVCACLAHGAGCSHRRTQFEAYLSLRNVTADGLICAPPSDRRCVVKCIHNAPETFRNALFEMWADVTAQEAYDVLEKPDVRVTNQSDKDAQLPKLLKLNEFAKEIVAPSAGPAPVVKLRAADRRRVAPEP